MKTIENVELIDNIRNDALILMASRPNLSYPEAYSLARQNLIGDEKVTDITFKPFTVDINLNDKQQEETFNESADEEIIEDTTISYYKQYAKDNLKGIINIDDYQDEQIKAYVIAHKMGVDISKFASELYDASQINFLAVMLASGKNIEAYLNNYNFDPKEELLKMADAKDFSV